MLLVLNLRNGHLLLISIHIHKGGVKPHKSGCDV